LSEETVVSYVSGRMPEAKEEELREHLAQCGDCVALVRDARSFLDAMAPERTRRRAVWPLALAASLALAAAAGVLLMRTSRPVPDTRGPIASRATPSNPWSGLRIAAAPAPPARGEEIVFRSEEEVPAAASNAFDSAVDSYRTGIYARAEKGFAAVLAQNPSDAEAHLYRGVCLIQLGRAAEAIAALEKALVSSDARVRGEARWYRALLRLKDGQFAEALEDLDALVASPGTRRKEAETLRSQVRAHVHP
jgi:tetratricopeptide (TPR) repeat protein